MRPTDGIEVGESEFIWCCRHLQAHFPPAKPHVTVVGRFLRFHWYESYLVACPSVSMMRGHLSQWVMTAAF